MRTPSPSAKALKATQEAALRNEISFEAPVAEPATERLPVGQAGSRGGSRSHDGAV